MAPAVDRRTLGAWLLKANPAVWDLRRFRADGEDTIRSWSVRRGYRSALMAPGDRVVLWLSGPGTGGLPRGVWGLGHVVAPAEPWVEGSARWWLDEGGRAGVRARVEVAVPLLEEPVPVAELRAAGITDLEVQRMPQGANPSYVTRDQLAALEAVLPDWPAAPAR